VAAGEAGVEAAVTARGDAELDDARGARDHDQEHAEDGGKPPAARRPKNCCDAWCGRWDHQAGGLRDDATLLLVQWTGT